jgi:RNA polymerase sigma-70 factor (ECF subfamily)
MEPSSAELDDAVRALLAAGQAEAAALRVLDTHGPGIHRMLRGVFHDDAIADDLYQRFSVELWQSIGGFEGRSSIYTWAWVLARRTVSWKLRQASHRREQRLRTDQQHALLADHWTRTATPAWQKTEVKNRFRALCEGLPEEDRVLVMLRIGERMDWRGIAAVLDEAGALEGDRAALDREAARLRKRFERVKGRLRGALAEPEAD